jgi:hypothetical protein
LFDHVKLEDDDRARLLENGVEPDDKFAHPCPHFINSSCAIYVFRPWRCGDYQCRVLSNMLEGEIDPQAAHALVDKARALRASINEALPEGLTITQLARDVRVEAAENRATPRLLALARFVAYRLFVERHFLNPKARWMTRDKA